MTKHQVSEQVYQPSIILMEHPTRVQIRIAFTVNFHVTMGRNVTLRLKNVMTTSIVMTIRMKTHTIAVN